MHILYNPAILLLVCTLEQLSQMCKDRNVHSNMLLQPAREGHKVICERIDKMIHTYAVGSCMVTK